VTLEAFLKLLEIPVVKVISWLWGSIIEQPSLVEPEIRLQVCVIGLDESSVFDIGEAA
jgi:hypothetical protein